MKKVLSLTLALALIAGLAVPALALAADGARNLPAAETVEGPALAPVGAITVDGGEVLDLSGVPNAPLGYIPMRAFCEAAGAHVSWYAEDNEAFFQVCQSGVVVNLGDLSVKLDNEPVEGVRAYLDPAGYTFLPLTFLTTIPNFVVDDHPEMDSIHYDITTRPARTPLETVADAVAEAAGVGSTMQLDMETMADFGIDPENFTELVALYPMMSANVSSIYVAEVAQDKMDAAVANFEALLDFLSQSFGNYPACAEMIAAGQIVDSPDGNHLALVVAPDVDAGVAAFVAAFPRKGR